MRVTLRQPIPYHGGEDPNKVFIDHNFLDGQLKDPAFLFPPNDMPRLRYYSELIAEVRRLTKLLHETQNGLTGSDLRKVLLPQLITKAQRFLEVAAGEGDFENLQQQRSAAKAWETVSLVLTSSQDLLNTEDMTDKQQLFKAVTSGKLTIDAAERLIGLMDSGTIELDLYIKQLEGES